MSGHRIGQKQRSQHQTTRQPHIRWTPSLSRCSGTNTMARIATIDRKTLETDITLTVDLDGTGVADIATGIGFLDHMLTALARHGLFDLMIRADGGLHIACNHTTEDIGIVLGAAIATALGDKRGIRRFGNALIPMDETLVEAAV